MTERTDLRGALLRSGVTPEEIAEAEADGTLELLGLERLIHESTPQYDLDTLVERSGMSAEQVRTLRRALGFPESSDEEQLFDDADLAMLQGTLAFLQQGAVEPEVALQITRVIGSAMERIATAHVDALSVRTGEEAAERDAAQGRSDPTDEYEAYTGLLAMMPAILDYVWRRHLVAAARRRRLRSRSGTGESVCVGFADMVGFTSTVRELPERELADVVSRFESIAYDVVQSHHGRVVKMIGDEVMFLADDACQGAEIALTLAERYRDDEALSDVRVGLGSGAVLERDGDVYGHVVNLASRIVSVAYPGSVVVSEGVHSILADDESFAFRELRASYLKDIGRERLWALRRSGDEIETRYQRARDRRAARREVLRDRIRTTRSKAARKGDGEEEGQSLDPSTDEIEAVVVEEDQLAEVSEEAVIATLRDELDDPKTEELQALSSVLSSDLEKIVETRDAKVSRVDEEFERRLAEVEEEARRRIDEIEGDVERSVRDAERRVEEARREAQRKISEAEAEAERAQREAATRIDEAERAAMEKARRASEEAERRRQKLSHDAARRAQKAGRDAWRRLKREARRGGRGGAPA